MNYNSSKPRGLRIPTKLSALLLIPKTQLSITCLVILELPQLLVYFIHSFVFTANIGKTSEGLYCGVAPSARCVWQPGQLPEEYKQYYGFSRFAIELNELVPCHVAILPPTDSRFRPDQRLLEEGKVQEAEASKLKLEQDQKERLIANEQLGKCHEPKWFRRTAVASDDEDGQKWEFANTYWDARAHSKFGGMDLVHLW